MDSTMVKISKLLGFTIHQTQGGSSQHPAHICQRVPSEQCSKAFWLMILYIGGQTVIQYHTPFGGNYRGWQLQGIILSIIINYIQRGDDHIHFFWGSSSSVDPFVEFKETERNFQRALNTAIIARPSLVKKVKRGDVFVKRGFKLFFGLGNPFRESGNLESG